MYYSTTERPSVQFAAITNIIQEKRQKEKKTRFIRVLSSVIMQPVKYITMFISMSFLIIFTNLIYFLLNKKPGKYSRYEKFTSTRKLSDLFRSIKIKKDRKQKNALIKVAIIIKSIKTYESTL